jgi:antitoxin (DNA-binding transcriptional repressor) of toxin-antitoxin stability system
VKTVTYRELSRQTTQVLEAVGRGEPVLVTSRGVPVAVVRKPLPAELEALAADLLLHPRRSR